MDKVANLRADERRDLFAEAAARRAMKPAIMEKDFWVCWALKHLFEDRHRSPHLVFKGGTSLSKAYGLIERFSEDVDLILDWRMIGYGQNATDPFQEFPSKTKQNQFNEQINAKAAEYIAETLVPLLGPAFEACPDVAVQVDPTDPHTVVVAYPRAFDDAYIRPAVCLEIGPLASWVPSSLCTIKPYAASEFPKLFEAPTCEVRVTTAERSFWEKATILHQEAHRVGKMPPRYARHYYDLSRLAIRDVCEAALGDLELLADVVEFKKRFYPCAWANYDAARPGSMRLVPAEARLTDLVDDYAAMQEMIFGDAPSFDEIAQTLHALETRINDVV